jgi:hypothetical protein
VLDRKKDMIIRSGLKVLSAKVEKVLLTHKQVADAAVVGRADAVHTEIVTAIVVLNQSDDVDQAKGLMSCVRWCREHLAPYEVPALVRVCGTPATYSSRKADAERSARGGGGGGGWTNSGNANGMGTERGRTDGRVEHNQREVAIRCRRAHRRWRRWARRCGRFTPTTSLNARSRKRLRANWPADRIDEVIIGNVVMPVDAANLARVRRCGPACRARCRD